MSRAHLSSLIRRASSYSSRDRGRREIVARLHDDRRSVGAGEIACGVLRGTKKV